MRKYLKIIYIVLILMSIFITSSQVYAATCSTCNGSGDHPTAKGFPCKTCGGRGVIPVSSHTPGEIIDGADAFIEIGEKDANSKINEADLANLSNTIYNILLTVGIIIAFIVGGILGIKYMIGGIEGQAEVKTMLVPYIIGCVVLFGAFTIWKIMVIVLK